MLSFFSKLIPKRMKKKNTILNPNQDVKMAFKLHGLASSINNDSHDEQLKSLETLRQGNYITEVEFQNAKSNLSQSL